MVNFIISIIFVVSFGGALFILARKLPVLANLPLNGTIGIRKTRAIIQAENKIKNFVLFFQKQIFFHKFLSWVKVMTLKIERNVDNMLHGIRKKAQKIDNKLK